MKKQEETELAILNALSTQFYKIVPQELQTCCCFNSRISKAVLESFGIESELLPCQVWLNTPSNCFVIGFTGNVKSGQWDGHVVCSTNLFLIDAALHHFKKDYGANVPSTLVAQRIKLPAQVISQRNLSDTDRLWWHNPPQGADTTLPEEPSELISKYSEQLIDNISERFQVHLNL